MKYIDFPCLGRRPSTEFVVAGVLDPEPAELEGVTSGEWVFNRDSVPMRRTEWWCHTPTQLWFLVERDTASDEVFGVSLAGGTDNG
jgi:sarcosine oxidase subunit delta